MAFMCLGLRPLLKYCGQTGYMSGRRGSGWWDIGKRVINPQHIKGRERMGELIFIGLGLHDEYDISLLGLKASIMCDKLFAEFYTSRLVGTNIGKIQNLTGKDIRVLSREEMEKGDIIIEAAEKDKVGVLVAGDPMTATTHQALRLKAKENDIETKLIHGASIITAAPGLSGLHIYKFGRTTSIPFSKVGFFPTSPYDVIKSNLDNGFHTLILLDIEEHEDKYMRANEALKVLLEMENERKENVISEDTLICVLGKVGSENPVTRAGYLKDLLKEDFGEGLHSLVLPGKLHFMEAEALVEFAGAPKEILEKNEK
jgi:diphthine synthase